MHRRRRTCHSPKIELGEQGAHVAGRADADRVAEGEFVGTEVHQGDADIRDLTDGHGPLPGVPETHRDIGADGEAGVEGTGHHGPEHLD